MAQESFDGGNPLMSAALAYAARGWPVFPLQPRGKLPITDDGYLSATTDPAKIAEWWRKTPNANIGIATGRPSGIWVLDVDRHEDDGPQSLAELERKHGALPTTVAQDTPSGGNHRVFHLNGVDIRNRAKVAPGLDVRGTGGYIVGPPSIHPNGKAYRWHSGASPEAITPAEAPRWLVDLVVRPKPPAPSNDRGAPPERYAAAALGNILAELSRATTGERNDALNRASFSLGQLVGASAISRGQCENALRGAALGLGLEPREIDATIKSGLDSGAQQPRQIPERKYTSPKHQARTNGPTERFDPETGEILSGDVHQSDHPPLAYQWFADVTPSLDTWDFVEGLLGDAAFSVWFGEPGCGKTFLVLDLALHVALGRPWFGREVEQGSVVYVAMEGVRGFRNRIAALRHHYGLDDDTVPLAVISSAVDLLDPAADAPRLIDAIRSAGATMEKPVRLVVFDTLSRSMSGGDENSPEDMGALVMNSQRIIAATGAHNLFIHHSGKDKSKGSRGHSCLLGNIDTEVEIVRDEVTRVSTVHVRKQRDLDMAEDFSFQLNSIELGTNGRGKPVTSCYVTLADTPENDPSERMRDTEQAALHEITELLARAGLPNITPEDRMTPVTAVKTGQLRDWFIKRGLLSLDNKGRVDGASRSRFNRALERLKITGHIRVHGEWLWIP